MFHIRHENVPLGAADWLREMLIPKEGENKVQFLKRIKEIPPIEHTTRESAIKAVDTFKTIKDGEYKICNGRDPYLDGMLLGLSSETVH